MLSVCHPICRMLLILLAGEFSIPDADSAIFRPRGI